MAADKPAKPSKSAPAEAAADPKPAANEKPAEPQKCGLIMPISTREGLPSTHWMDVKNILVSALKEDGLEVDLVSEAAGSDFIQRTIVHNLYAYPVCICDLSTLNPNVMFELGVRLTFDQPTVLIRDDQTVLPFDLTLIRYLEYPRDLRYPSIRAFKGKLRKWVKEAQTEAGKRRSFMKAVGGLQVPKLEATEVSGVQFLAGKFDELMAKFDGLHARTPGIPFIRRVVESDLPAMPVPSDSVMEALRLALKSDGAAKAIYSRFFSSDPKSSRQAAIDMASLLSARHPGVTVMVSDAFAAMSQLLQEAARQVTSDLRQPPY